MKTLVFLKTHFINDFVLNELNKLKTCDNKNHKTILFIDNHTKFLDTHENGIKFLNFNGIKQECFILDEENYKETKLPYFTYEINNKDFSKVMWYNCDYPFYIIRKYYPEYNYYWQIESDVFMNGKSYKPFFERNKKNNDFIAKSLQVLQGSDNPEKKTPFDWAYPPDMLKYSCLFPIVRLSEKAIDFLYKRRISQSKILEKIKNNGDNRWIYCENFVPIELVSNKFKCTTLEEEFVYLMLLTEDKKVPTDTPDDKLYHPVKSNN